MEQEGMEQLKRQRASAKRKFTRKLNLFKESVSREDPVPVLQHNYGQVGDAYKEVERIHDEYIDLLSEIGIEDSSLESEEAYIMELEQKRNDAHILLVRKSDLLPKTNDDVIAKVKVKALNPPVFDGDIREYPAFKSDFERLVNKSFGKDPFALKQCLTGEALRTVKGVETDYEQMFKRLDEKYANNRKLVDLILGDLKSLRKIPDGDSKGFVKMVEKVERCWLDLKRMKLSAEMNTSNTVSHIEKVLPMPQKREWVILAEKISDHDKVFTELLDFLLREKRVLEYMDSGIRNSGNIETKANVHNVTDNQASESNTHELAQAIKKIQESQECQSKILEQCMTNLTHMVANMSANEKVENKTTRHANGKCCWFHATEGHDILDCTAFQMLDNYRKINVLRKNGICFNCLRGYHVASQCNVRDTCDIRSNNVRCGRPHHRMLHQAHYDGIMFHSTGQVNENLHVRRKTLLMISKVFSKGQPITTLWDSGSNITIITHELAFRLGLKGRDIDISMTKVGNITDSYSSKEYLLPLTDKEGKEWLIKAIGMKEISSEEVEVDISDVVSLFEDEGISYCDIERPTGDIELLVGTDYCELLPNVVKMNGNLQLLKNQFGYCIRGSHPVIKCQVNNSNHVNVRINHLASLSHVSDIVVEPTDSIKTKLDHFFDVESLGTQCTPKCGGCKCGKCALGNQNYTLQEERELALIEKGLSYEESTHQWTVEYPWIKDPNLLPNNVSVAIARMKSTEKRLFKLGPEYARSYQNQMNDMINRKVSRKLSRSELQTYNGPIHYIHHHEVPKPDSISTPLRIVFNSSASYMGHVLNDYWCKGPNVLTNQLAILFRFRQREVAIAGDISKMYHTIKLSDLDQHTHRFVWRDMKTEDAPKHYALTSVAFGDKPSGIIAMLALRHTTEMHHDNYPKVTDMIVNNTYVDDILYSVDTKLEAYDLIRDTERILKFGGFVIKHWIVSGVNIDAVDFNILSSDKEKILGLHWNPKEDNFTYKVRVNFSAKHKKVCTGPNMTRMDIVHRLPNVLTKRMILSQIASIYDPLGLVTPFTLEAKILMRKLVTYGDLSNGKGEYFGWDDPIPDDMRELWKIFFVNLYDLESLSFKRCLKPISAEGNPSLIVFSDGSSQAYGSCAYVRWILKCGKYKCNLIAAKSRIAPSRQLTIPRLELCGAVLACRLREMIVREFDWTFESVFHIVDSAIVRAQIQKESYGFSTFVATRVAEIQSKTNPNEWWWVPSGDNIADLTTKPFHPSSLGSDSLWQNGPDYLSLPLTDWPISKLSEESLPDRIGITLACSLTDNINEFNLKVIDITRFNSYNKLLRVTARLLTSFKDKSFRAVLNKPCIEAMKKAEEIWIKEAQKDIAPDWKVRYQRLGPVKDNEGIITVGERISKWLKDNWNCNSYILLPSKHPFTKLYILHLHNIDHAGIEVTLAKLQSKFWVPGARKEIMSVKHKCIKCRQLNCNIEGQRMGQVMPERLQPSPPFYHTAIDLFGPFNIKDTVKRRTKCKVYGVLFNCLASRAVYIDLAEGYSTEDFLTTFRRFVALRGFPKTIHSDGGSQLVSASKELRQMMSTWNTSEILQFGTDQGLTWSFNKAAEAPWQNGCSEALIKVIKRLILMSIGDSVLTFGELQTVFFEVANLTNERPIGIKPGTNIELGSYLCPNDLILGRASIKVPSGAWDNASNDKHRLNFIQKIVNSFWRRWQRDYFPTLIIRQKWHASKRNLQVGDIVLVQESSAILGKWKLAQVVVANPGYDGRVRNVTLRYKIQRIDKKYDGQPDTLINRSVHKLVVLLPIEEQC